MIDSNLLEYLLIFSKTGSLLKSSELLHISQPSLSKAMQKLEAELDINIFDRSANKLVLNDNGKSILPYVEDIIAMNNRLIQKAKEIKDNENTISIGFTAPGPMYKFANLFALNTRKFKITTKIEDEESLIRGLNSNYYDLIFINNLIKNEEFICRKAMTEKLYITIPPTHLLAGMKNGVYWKDIDGQSFLLFNYIGYWEKILSDNLIKSRFIRSSDNNDLKEIVEYSTIPSFLTDATIKYNSVEGRINIPILDDSASLNFYAVCKKKNEKILNFLD